MSAATVTEIQSQVGNSLNPLRPAWLPPKPEAGPAPEETLNPPEVPAPQGAPSADATVAMPRPSDPAPAAVEREVEDSTLALLEDADPAIQAFYARMLPWGASPTACVPYWPCA